MITRNLNNLEISVFSLIPFAVLALGSILIKDNVLLYIGFGTTTILFLLLKFVIKVEVEE
jgi:hypothetical protein